MTILNCNAIDLVQLQTLLARYGLTIHLVENNNKIPGSWFGEPEAGIIENRLYIRNDTPLHSALHESCHYICMPEAQRANLHTNAGGDYDEENAVCYLSILLSEYIDGFGQERMLQNMDEWGYTFRLGSSKAWFLDDAQDALIWLQQHQLVNSEHQPSWKLRQ